MSEPTFNAGTLLLPGLAALVPVSNRLHNDASTNPAMDQVLKQDLAEVLAQTRPRIHQRHRHRGEPLGIINTQRYA